MSKLFSFFRISKDIFFQIEGSLAKRFQFLYGITSHYLLKTIEVSYTKFPELKIRTKDCVFLTRKNTIDFWMFWKDYEKETFMQLEKEAKQGDTLIDIGANIGIYSVTMAKRGLNVHSFEPIKSNFELLKKNILGNKLENVKAFNVALGSKKEEKDISYNPHEHGEGSLVLNIKGSVKEKVQVEKLDNLKIKPEKNCFMKIDVEGFELEVLKGTEKFIKKYKPKIIIEIWSEKTVKFLEALGYKKEGEIWHPTKRTVQ